jgi:hypothetical protein
MILLSFVKTSFEVIARYQIPYHFSFRVDAFAKMEVSRHIGIPGPVEPARPSGCIEDFANDIKIADSKLAPVQLSAFSEFDFVSNASLQ